MSGYVQFLDLTMSDLLEDYLWFYCAYTSSKNIKPALGSEYREKTVKVGVYQVNYEYYST